MLQCPAPLRRIRRFCHFAASAPLFYSTEGATAKSARYDPTSIADPNAKAGLNVPALIRLKKERDPDKLFEIFKANAGNCLVVENKYAFQDTVKLLAGAGKHQYIEDLLEQQKSLSQGRREGFIVRIIMLYGVAGMTKHAVDTFYDMHLFGCKRTVKSFNAALKVLSQTRNVVAVCSFIKDVPVKYGIRLDIISMNIVISALCGMGFIHKAYLLMLEMELSGIQADVVSYTTLISACYKNSQWIIATGLWNLMVRRGCYPNVATFNSRIQFLVNQTKPWAANDLMNSMESLGMQPDEVTYNLVFKGFCRAGRIDIAKRVYSGFLGRGYSPNIKIYQTLVHYLCEVGEFYLAYSMCKDCMMKIWLLSEDTAGKLIQGLIKSGKPDEARSILMLADERHPPFRTYKLEAFRSTLTRT